MSALLYIEDNDDNISLVKALLKRRPQIELHVATNGRDGVQAAIDKRPDLILLDNRLPDATGSEILRELVSRPATAAIPVVILSSDSNEIIARLLAYGTAECSSPTTSPTIPVKLPEAPSGAPLGAAPNTPVPLRVASGGSSMMILAIGGTPTGAMRMPARTCVAAAWGDRGTIFGPGGGGGGGAPGVTSVVTRNARPKVCGEIIGASSAQPIIIAWLVKPMAVAQTLLVGRP